MSYVLLHKLTGMLEMQSAACRSLAGTQSSIRLGIARYNSEGSQVRYRYTSVLTFFSVVLGDRIDSKIEDFTLAIDEYGLDVTDCTS